MKPQVCKICRHIKATKGYATVEVRAKAGTKTIRIKLCEECAAASLEGLENRLSEIMLHDAVEGVLRTMIRWKKELSRMEWRGLKTKLWGGKVKG